MGNEFKDFEMETPSLTLEPDLGELEKKEEVLPKKQSGRDGVEGWKPARKKSVPEFEAPHGAERTRRRRGVCLSLEDTKE